MAWIDSLFQRETAPVLELSMALGHQKQLAIMNNIANIDNPHYRRQATPDREFTKMLDRAIQQRAKSHINEFVPKSTSNIKFGNRSVYPSRINIMYGKDQGTERHDRNNVTIESEMANLAKNTLDINLLQRLYKKKFTMLRAASRNTVT